MNIGAAMALVDGLKAEIRHVRSAEAWKKALKFAKGLGEHFMSGFSRSKRAKRAVNS